MQVPVQQVESVQRLREEYDDPFVRWQLDPALVRRSFRYRGGVVVEHSHDRFGNPVSAPALLCLGKPDDLHPLLASVAESLDATPGRVTVEAHAVDALPPGWEYHGFRTWDFMWSDTVPPPYPGEGALEVLRDRDEIDALLDRANPGTHGRPGDPGSRLWLGARDGTGRLLAVGGLFALGSGTPNLRGISTLTAARGHGLGSAISARLARHGLATMAPVVTLGVYTDNLVAIAVYERLGFRHGHTFVSGELRRERSSSTTASAPSA